MLRSSCIGFCRNNEKQELGSIVKSYLDKEIGENELRKKCNNIRLNNWKLQKKYDIDFIQSNDFSMYDSVLDTTCLVGNIQRRFYWEGGSVPLSVYFTMVLGQQKDKFDIFPLEIQNWLNTNYLYFVPEFVDPIEFAYSDNKPIVEYLEAKSAGIETQSVILGPISYLMLGKSKEPDIQPLDLLDELLLVYQELFLNYKRIGVKDVQIDEPILVFDVNRNLQSIYAKCYEKLKLSAGDINLHLINYYGDIHENFDFISTLPVSSIHIDATYNNQYIEDYCKKITDNKKLSIGIVDARNVWINNLERSIDTISRCCDILGDDKIIVATSSPLFLCPYSKTLENDIKPEVKDRLSFAVEKLEELKIIKNAINNGKSSVKDDLTRNSKLLSNFSKEYSIFDRFCEVKKINKKKSQWKTFSNDHKLPNLTTMIGGEINDEFFDNEDDILENSIELQQKAGLDVISCSWLKKSYDVSSFDGKVDGLLTLKHNVIPRFGHDYYHPTIIYDYPKFKANIFVDCVKKAKKYIKKKQPLKFSVISPNNFINISFVSPYLDIRKVNDNIKDGLIQNIEAISNNIDILQVNDLSFSSNIFLQNSKNAYQIKSACYELNNFISQITNINCIAVYSAYTYLNEIIEELCRINADVLLLESSRSMHEILNSFVSYKPTMCIGIGVFDTFDNRVATKNEISIACKKISGSFDPDHIIIMPDCDFYMKNNKKTILKTLSTMSSVVSIFRSKLKEL